MRRATTATVMFTDVVGSTALSLRLGAARADEARREHFDLVRQVLAGHGGEQVKTLGDGVMAVFPSVTDAVDGAVAIQQAVEAANRGRPDALSLRVGLSVGEVSIEDGDYFGTAVVEAARLCAAADPRQVLSASVIRRLAGARCRHAFRPLGVLELKGLRDPVDAEEVAWAPLVDRGLSADFSRVDHAERPDVFIRTLDDIRGIDVIAEVGRRVLELLAPVEDECLLDVGSGTGEDVLVLARLVGPDGLVVGVDRSETMVAEARRRASAAGLSNVRFEAGDADRLELDDDSVDGCRSERVLQYLVEPLDAVREMARVTRPGGRVVVADSDWETAVLDTEDLELTSRINRAWCETRQSGRVGRQLHGMLIQAGMDDVATWPHTLVVSRPDPVYLEQIVPARASQAVSIGAVTEQEASRWVAAIEAAAAEGRFFSSFTMFVAYGRVPD